MSVILRCRDDLDLDRYQQVAWGGHAVSLHHDAIETIERARQAFMSLIDSDEQIVIYGVTSGYGQRAHQRFSLAERKAHAAKAPLAAAVGFGALLPERIVRGMVLARLSNFVEGHAAVTSSLARAVAAMLDGGRLPPVPEQGITSAGEIIGLAHLFGALGQSRILHEKESLALVNGAPVAAALVCDAVLCARVRLQRAVEVLALSAEAMLAPLDAYDPQFETLWGDEHEAAALGRRRPLGY